MIFSSMRRTSLFICYCFATSPVSPNYLLILLSESTWPNIYAPNNCIHNGSSKLCPVVLNVFGCKKGKLVWPVESIKQPVFRVLAGFLPVSRSDTRFYNLAVYGANRTAHWPGSRFNRSNWPVRFSFDYLGNNNLTINFTLKHFLDIFKFNKINT